MDFVERLIRDFLK